MMKICTIIGVPRIIDTYTRAMAYNTFFHQASRGITRTTAVNTAMSKPMTNEAKANGIVNCAVDTTIGQNELMRISARSGVMKGKFASKLLNADIFTKVFG